jgi:hypothetical protein
MLKRILKIGLPLAGLVAAFFYFMSPGWLLGGINDITRDSRISVFVQEFIRANPANQVNPAQFLMDQGERAEFELNPQQVLELRSLLRNSWYSRRLGSGPRLFPIPHDWQGHYEFFIVISSENPVFIDLSTLTGHLRRSGERSSTFRIHNSGWEEELFRILNMTR